MFIHKFRVCIPTVFHEHRVKVISSFSQFFKDRNIPIGSGGFTGGAALHLKNCSQVFFLLLISITTILFLYMCPSTPPPVSLKDAHRKVFVHIISAPGSCRFEHIAPRQPLRLKDNWAQGRSFTPSWSQTVPSANLHRLPSGLWSCFN